MKHAISSGYTTPSDHASDLREELDMIGYAISHDLQAPLRVIQSCCNELTAQPNLSAIALSDARMMDQEAARLKTMLQGVLDYIRLETFEVTFSMLDSNELVETAKASLSAEINASGARITADALPQVWGHRARLTQLFAYLIDNAIKFHGTAAPMIHISARPVQSMWEFCVEDNGIGIKEEHQRIVFRLFQRLHTADHYPGHGIGLALVHKIIETHGGRLWVESQPGEGSCFYFTLPSKEGSCHSQN